jgi:hypothetical protein
MIMFTPTTKRMALIILGFLASLILLLILSMIFFPPDNEIAQVALTGLVGLLNLIIGFIGGVLATEGVRSFRKDGIGGGNDDIPVPRMAQDRKTPEGQGVSMGK